MASFMVAVNPLLNTLIYFGLVKRYRSAVLRMFHWHGRKGTTDHSSKQLEAGGGSGGGRQRTTTITSTTTTSIADRRISGRPGPATTSSAICIDIIHQQQ
jgi:hypothetical protein